MKRAAAITHCLSLPGAYLDNPWGPEDSVVKVGGKIFAFVGGEKGPFAITLKNTADVIDEWRSRYPDHAGPAAYLSKTLWDQIKTTGRGAPDAEEIRELIEDSYDLIVAKLPKSQRPHPRRSRTFRCHGRE
ncbi:MAG: MmcQ/YjbR family DNA-binding protein, partial [Jatrophihabitans sp.]